PDPGRCRARESAAGDLQGGSGDPLRVRRPGAGRVDPPGLPRPRHRERGDGRRVRAHPAARGAHGEPLRELLQRVCAAGVREGRLRAARHLRHRHVLTTATYCRPRRSHGGPAASPGRAAPQPVEGAPILLGGTPHALVAAGHRSTQRRVRGRRAVLVALLRDRGAGARGEHRADDEDALAARGPDPDRLARADLLGGLHPLTVHVDVTAPAGGRRRGAGAEHAHGPQPHVDPHGGPFGEVGFRHACRLPPEGHLTPDRTHTLCSVTNISIPFRCGAGDRVCGPRCSRPWTRKARVNTSSKNKKKGGLDLQPFIKPALIAGGAIVVLGIIVLVAIWLRTIPSVEAFVEKYPGQDPANEVESGLPAWLGWQHFLNAFFMLLLIRPGILVRI